MDVRGESMREKRVHLVRVFPAGMRGKGGDEMGTRGKAGILHGGHEAPRRGRNTGADSRSETAMDVAVSAVGCGLFAGLFWLVLIAVGAWQR